MLVNEHHPEEPGNRTWADIVLTELEQIFILRFDSEILTDRPGPASSWLSHHALPPDLMVAFQWAMSPQGCLQPDPCGFTPCPIPFQPPWPSARSFIARVEEIVAAYPWLKPYVKTTQSAPSGDPEEDNTVDQILMYRLIRGRYYAGRGRYGNVGRWDGQHFLVIGEKCDRYEIRYEGYNAEWWGCFQPFRIIDE